MIALLLSLLITPAQGSDLCRIVLKRALISAQHPTSEFVELEGVGALYFERERSGVRIVGVAVIPELKADPTVYAKLYQRLLRAAQGARYVVMLDGTRKPLGPK